MNKRTLKGKRILQLTSPLTIKFPFNNRFRNTQAANAFQWRKTKMRRSPKLSQKQHNDLARARSPPFFFIGVFLTSQKTDV